ncbi:DNA primase [candidate division WWE3 bacterium]|uniref:DNA primase n=1 Tax=candidate division WWE3 bacterium TaxID=2053526 RepID=A0A955LHD6_UNCKA|nr:DNA primase [candidate division WWE3 bacterium]
MDDVEKVREKADIVEFIGKFTKLTATGKNFKGVCPIHNEKTASFFVRPDRGLWYCFGCQKGGDIFNFLMEKENLPFGEALQVLAKHTGVTLTGRQDAQVAQKKERLLQILSQVSQFYQEQLASQSGTKAKEYLTGRGITEDMIKLFEIGYAPDGWETTHTYLTRKGFAPQDIEEAGLSIARKNNSGHYDRFRDRVMFPVSDHLSRVVGFSGRVLSSEKEAKYINTPETLVFKKGNLLFGYDKAQETAQEKGFTILVEGNLDVVSLVGNGIPNVVAPLGTGLTEYQLKLLNRVSSKLMIAFDSDEAGKNATVRAVHEAAKLGFETKVVTITGAKDPDEAVRSDKKKLITDFRMAQPGFMYLLNRGVETFGNSSPYNKKKTAEYMFSFLAEITDNIVRDSYFDSLASELGVPSASLKKDFQNWSKQSNRETTATDTRPATITISHQPEMTKDRQMLLEDYFISLLFNVTTTTLKRFLIREKVHAAAGDEIFTQDFHGSIFKKVLKLVTDEEFDLTDVIQSLSDEAQTQLDRIVLKDFGDVLDREDDALKELDRVLKSLQKSRYQTMIRELTKQKQTITDSEEVSAINKRIREYTEQLRNV